jgi:hypothetical protein
MTLDSYGLIPIICVGIACAYVGICIFCPTAFTTTTEEQITIISWIPDGPENIYILTSGNHLFRVADPDRQKIITHPMPYQCTISIESHPSLYINYLPRISLLPNSSLSEGATP